jgi:hypothetical protein
MESPTKSQWRVLGGADSAIRSKLSDVLVKADAGMVKGLR